MENYDNNDSVTMINVKSVMLKMIWIVYMRRKGQFQLYVFSYSTEMPASKEKQLCLWTSDVCRNIKVCLLNV